MRREKRADMMLVTLLGLITVTWIAVLVFALTVVIEG
jgi:hypothetical protein